MTSEISAAVALEHLEPDWLDSLSDAETLVLAFAWDVWLRVNQEIPTTGWAYFGFICGRGFGKSHAIACWINGAVERGEICHRIALVGPNLERVLQTQVQMLIDSSPPWFKAEKVGDGVRWPNGMRADAFTAEAPEVRGPNFDLAWLSEIVAWPANTRKSTFDNVTTATRLGLARVIWDTTSKGSNQVIKNLIAMSAKDPERYRLTRGSMFDNPMLGAEYLASECMKYVPGTQRYGEEILGQVYDESTEALWTYDSIERNRRAIAPNVYDVKILAFDPAQSARPEADETGFVIAQRDSSKQIWIADDLSGRRPAAQWAEMLVEQCCNHGASGIVTERNNSGDWVRDLVKVLAEQRGFRLEDLPVERPFPPRTPGRIYYKAHTATRSKHQRAEGPAALYAQNRVHHVGVLEALESELTTWEPDSPKSPNRLDALAYAVAELTDLARAPVTAREDMTGGLGMHDALKRMLAKQPARRI